MDVLAKTLRAHDATSTTRGVVMTALMKVHPPTTTTPARRDPPSPPQLTARLSGAAELAKIRDLLHHFDTSLDEELQVVGGAALVNGGGAAPTQCGAAATLRGVLRYRGPPHCRGAARAAAGAHAHV